MTGLARRSGILATTRAGGLILDVLLLAAMARLLGPRSLGSLAAALALLGIGAAIAEFGLLQTTVMSLAERDGDSAVLGEAFRASVVLGAISLVVSVAVGFVVLPATAHASLLWLMPWFVISRLDVAFAAHQQANHRTAVLATADTVNRAVPLVFVGAALAWTVPANASVALVALALALGEVARLAVLAPHVELGGAPSRTAVLGLIRRALPLGFTNAVSQVHVRSDQVVLSSLGYRTGLALYAVAYRFVDAALLIANAVGAATFPALVQAGESERLRATRAVIRMLALVGILLAVVAFVAAPVAVRLVGGGEFAGAATLVRWLSPVIAVAVVNMGFAQSAIAAGRASILARASVLIVAANVVLTILLVHAMGVKGAAVATLITETLGLVVVAAIAATPARREVAVA